MSEDNNRYTRNRNNWKKVYPKVGSKPRIIQYSSPENGVTNSIDLQKYQRDRNMFRIFPDYGYISSSFTPIPTASAAIWEDARYAITSSTTNLEYTITFSTAFANPPIVVYSITSDEPSRWWFTEDMVDLDFLGGAFPSGRPVIMGYGLPTLSSSTFRLSAPYTGSIHYYAMDPTVGAAFVSVNPIYWYTTNPDDDLPQRYEASCVETDTGIAATPTLYFPNLGTPFSFNDDMAAITTPYQYTTDPDYSIIVAKLDPFGGPTQVGDNYEFAEPDSRSSITMSFSTTREIVLHTIAFGPESHGGG